MSEGAAHRLVEGLVRHGRHRLEAGHGGPWRRRPLKVTVPALGTAEVDLRSTVTDASGASLTETLIDAYNSGCADIWC
ncbi:hypothetical protein [Streptomyces sp. NPDC001933]|uniref:hypothetical protein n=1 Tax=Streptomyces sp. NPDC001933 TaxID=3364626 RepID=UPI00367CC46D